MTETEAIERARLKESRIAVVTVGVWVVTLGATWLGTRGDYYRTFPNAAWFWAWAFVLAWTVSAYYVLEESDAPDVEEVSLSDLKLGAGTHTPAKLPTLSVAEVDRRREVVLGAYGAFLSDLVEIATYPLLADPTCPATDAFREWLVRVEDARFDAVRSEEKIEPYLACVQQLEKAWEAARLYARRKGYSTLTKADRDAVRRARQLLDVALNDTAYAPERRAALNRAMLLLRSVVEVPDQATTAIEHRVGRLEIEG